MEETCNTGLVLGIGGGMNYNLQRRDLQKTPVKFHLLFPPNLGSVERRTEELELERSSSRTTEEEEEEEENHNHSNARKKLRLTKEQSGLLEECFKEHSTLNPRQKQALADRLNLRPRQVEVWFQNRRARTKLKQTEVDCELLKKYCDNLTDENRRLKKELQELRALKLGSPLCIQFPAATTLTMCPSCERVGTNEGNNPFAVAKTKLYDNKTNPSLAC